MNTLKENIPISESDAAKARLLSVRGDPFLFADWENVLFLHFAIAPELLRPLIRPPLELDLYEGQAHLSVVAVTMRRFQPARLLPFAWPLRLISRQQFLNVRTYVHHRDEPGALFLWGWLSKLFPPTLPTFGLPCAFAAIDYHHDLESGQLRGKVQAGTDRLSYHATMAPQSTFEPCSPRSLSEFTMERYTGFFYHGRRTKIFRAWHPPWLETDVDVSLNEISLIANKFPWFKEAKLVGGNFAPGFKRVSLGRVRSLKTSACQSRKRGHGPSAFYEMP